MGPLDLCRRPDSPLNIYVPVRFPLFLWRILLTLRQAFYDPRQANLPHHILRRLHARPLLTHIENAPHTSRDTTVLLAICHPILHHRHAHARRMERRPARSMGARHTSCCRMAESHLGHLWAASWSDCCVAPDVISCEESLTFHWRQTQYLTRLDTSILPQSSFSAIDCLCVHCDDLSCGLICVSCYALIT